MKIHRLERSQRLPIGLDEAWEFFADPANLAEITPGWLAFEVTSRDLPPRMHPGMIVTYTVRPVLGVPVAWVTEVTHVVEPVLFVDEQRFGPYRFWHHQHHFRAVDGGVEARDVVHYALPPGGGPVARWVVAPRLERIFAHRRDVLRGRFGELP